MTAAATTLPMGLDEAPTRVHLRRARDKAACTPVDADCVRISGELVGDAHIRYQAGTLQNSLRRNAWLECRLVVPGGQFVDVSMALGTKIVDHMAADQRTRYLRHGQRCTVWAKGLMTATKHGVCVLVPLHPSVYLDTAPPRHETAGDRE